MVMTQIGTSAISFGDTVLVLDTEQTRSAGVASIRGVVYGETTPSVTKVEVIGEPTEDFAINVQPDTGESFWITEQLLELIDHSPGLDIQIGDQKAVRNPDGSWGEIQPSSQNPWWKFWQKS